MPILLVGESFFCESLKSLLIFELYCPNCFFVFPKFHFTDKAKTCRGIETWVWLLKSAPALCWLMIRWLRSGLA